VKEGSLPRSGRRGQRWSGAAKEQ